MTPSRVVVLSVNVLIFASAVAFGQTNGPAIAKAEQPNDFTIRTTSRLVLLDVSVKDASGGFVSGLSKDRFQVYENGRPQQITHFADADIPVTVGIAVDESGSMRPKRAEVITAALTFNQASNPKDEMFIVNFNEKPRLGLPDGVLFSDSVQQLRSAFWHGNPEGRTALYDALEMSLRHLEFGRQSKKALVVISDGGDNHSSHTLEDVMSAVLTSATTIYTIGIYDEDDPETNEGVLRKLAHVSGGVFYHPKTLDEIVPICRQIAKDIRSRYTIGYVPSTEGKMVRHIKVAASAADHATLNVRTRTSYVFADRATESQ
jgi:Ca-activated chloride channel family protein